jgi:hypothetical protein
MLLTPGATICSPVDGVNFPSTCRFGPESPVTRRPPLHPALITLPTLDGSASRSSFNFPLVESFSRRHCGAVQFGNSQTERIVSSHGQRPWTTMPAVRSISTRFRRSRRPVVDHVGASWPAGGEENATRQAQRELHWVRALNRVDRSLWQLASAMVGFPLLSPPSVLLSRFGH